MRRFIRFFWRLDVRLEVVIFDFLQAGALEECAGIYECIILLELWKCSSYPSLICRRGSSARITSGLYAFSFCWPRLNRFAALPPLPSHPPWPINIADTMGTAYVRRNNILREHVFTNFAIIACYLWSTCRKFYSSYPYCSTSTR